MFGKLDMARFNKTSNFLARLRRDEAGNTLIITAALLFPMIAIVGSGVDMSRAYMTKARLQAACDAGVLGARKAMISNSLSADAQTKGTKMFNFNFKNSDYSTNNTVFSMTASPTDGEVTGIASTEMPNILMKIFNFNQFDLSVGCSAELQIANIDTTLILDVTGSMANCPNGTNSCGNGGAGSRIAGLRSAVRTFYNTLEQAKINSPLTRIRYGFVPYSQTVDVSSLIVNAPAEDQLSTANLRNNYPYQWRVANMTRLANYTEVFGPEGAPVTQTSTQSSAANCTAWGNNDTYTGSVAVAPGSGANPAGRTYNNNTLITYNSVTQVCSRTQAQSAGVYQPNYAFNNWTYQQVNVDVSQAISSNSLQLDTITNCNTSAGNECNGATTTVGTPGSYSAQQLRNAARPRNVGTTSISWNGCVVERDTVTNQTFAPIPGGAIDLNTVSGGSNDPSRWRLHMDDLTYIRANANTVTTTNNASTASDNCPAAPIRNINEITASELDAYLPLLTPRGSTYHDIGMTWGLRLASPVGLFAARNTATPPNGGVVGRHIIFMTDGEMAPRGDTYSAYETEQMDNRVTGGAGSLTTRHNNRFQAMCDKARSEGISLWVIAFGQALTANLTSCADPGRAYAATSTAELEDIFRQIANQIADLRLSQ
jgi:Flp pilus assembly protein TadG